MPLLPAPPSGPDGSSQARLAAWTWRLGWIYGLCSVLWMVSGKGTTTKTGEFLVEVSPEPLLLAAVVVFGCAAVRRSLDPWVRRAFAWLCVGFGLSLIGDFWWVYDEFARGLDPRFTLANVPYLLSYPVTIAGVLSFPVARRERLEWWKYMLDTKVVLLAGIIAIWYFAVRPLLASQADPALQAVSLVYPVADLLALTAFTTMLLRPQLDGRESARRLLAAGMFAILLADLMYEPPVFQSIASVQWPTVLYTASYLLLLRSGLGYLREVPSVAQPVTHQLARLQPLSWLPFGTAALVIVALLLAATSPWQSPLSPLVLGAIGLAVLLAARYVMTASQNLGILREQIVHEGEIRVQSLVENAADPILLLDSRAIVRFASPASRPTLGLPPADLLGLALPSLAHPDDAVRLAQFLDNSHLPPGTSATIWMRLHHSDGSWRNVEAVATNLIDLPSVHGIVINLRDVTERDTLEARLRQADRLDAVGRLAGEVAHEFNSLLTGVLGHAELLLNQVGPQSALRGDLGQIREAAARCADLTQQLLAYSGHQTGAPRPVAFGLLLRHMMSEFADPTTDNVRYITEVEPALGWVRGDAKRLQQAVTVLLRGARSAAGPGGTLTLRATNLEVAQKDSHRYGGIRPGPYVIVEVGVGDPDRTAGTPMVLFEPWATREKSDPVGELGLASVEAVIRRCRGVMGVERHPGGASHFVFLLPRILLPAADQMLLPATLSERPGAGTVLLVDDEPVVLRVARRTLAACGYRVLTASNVEEARRLSAVHASSIDLLLTDVRMPDGTGPEVAADLMSRNGAIRVLYMSGYAANELEDVFGPALERVLLQKPFTLRELLDEVERALA